MCAQPVCHSPTAPAAPGLRRRGDIGPALGVLTLAACALFITPVFSQPGFSQPAPNQQLLFEDVFNGTLGAGWSWVREHREAWRASERGLEVRVEPGNMWGKANNARNVLIRRAPDLPAGGLEITATVENRPTAQYEQVDLVWYYDDSHMVKIGQELVDGQLSIVMGREENDRTRTIRIVPLKAFEVELRFLVTGTIIRGQFRPAGSDAWQDVGETDLPAPAGIPAYISLQFYQGPADAEHWARVSRFRALGHRATAERQP